MNSRTLVVLALITALVLGLALWLVSRPGGEVTESELPLVPGLKEQVNDIEAIDIVTAGGEPAVRLRRERERWRVAEKFDYEADFRLVHDLLRDLAEGRRVEERTANPEWYPRLGVAGMESESAQGMAVRFPDTELPGVIFGKADSAGIGNYVRLESEERSWLADRSPEIPTEPLEWLERAIMDIPASDIEAVTIRHPDGEIVQLRPAGEEGDTWVLLNVPEGREAGPAWEMRQTAGALGTLNLEDVRPHESVPDDAVRALYHTNDGLNFVASLFADEAGHWVHFSVSPEVEASEEAEPGEDETELTVDAAAVDGRLSPWQFRISESRFDRMTRRLGDLLAEESEDG